MYAVKFSIFVLIFLVKLERTFNENSTASSQCYSPIIKNHQRLSSDVGSDAMSYLRLIHSRKNGCSFKLRLLLLLLSGDVEVNPGPQACSAYNCTIRRPKKDENIESKISFHK